MVCKDYRKNRSFEDLSVQKWLEYLIPGQTALDIGSYSGLYAILAAKVCKSVAIEPNKTMALRIAQNAIKNDVTVKILNVAAGKEKGSCSLKMNFPTSSAAHCVPGDQISVIKANFDNVCAVKIDVEGMELDVLQGMDELPPLIIAEALSDRSEMQLIDYLKSYKVSKDGRNLIFERGVRP